MHRPRQRSSQQSFSTQLCCTLVDGDYVAHAEVFARRRRRSPNKSAPSGMFAAMRRDIKLLLYIQLTSCSHVFPRSGDWATSMGTAPAKPPRMTPDACAAASEIQQSNTFLRCHGRSPNRSGAPQHHSRARHQKQQLSTIFTKIPMAGKTQESPPLLRCQVWPWPPHATGSMIVAGPPIAVPPFQVIRPNEDTIATRKCLSPCRNG